MVHDKMKMFLNKYNHAPKRYTKRRKIYFLPFMVHDKRLSVKIDVYFLGGALKSTHLYNGEIGDKLRQILQSP